MRLYIDEFSTLFSSCEDYYTIDEREESVVFTHTDVEAGMMLSATLTLQDVACLAVRPTVDFHAESFAF